MSTIGERVVQRLDAIEAAMAEMQTNTTVPEMRQYVDRQLTEIREQIGRATPVDGRSNGTRSLYSSKEFLPEKLGDDHKQRWRVWS